MYAVTAQLAALGAGSNVHNSAYRPVDNDDIPLDGAKFGFLRVTIWSEIHDFKQ
jgi:hypothetical protein